MKDVIADCLNVSVPAELLPRPCYQFPLPALKVVCKVLEVILGHGVHNFQGAGIFWMIHIHVEVPKEDHLIGILIAHGCVHLPHSSHGIVEGRNIRSNHSGSPLLVYKGAIDNILAKCAESLCAPLGSLMHHKRHTSLCWFVHREAMMSYLYDKINKQTQGLST